MTDVTVTAPTTPSFRLDGKKALITGASRGIGFATAAALAQAGAKVVLSSRSEADLKAACAAIEKHGEACDYVVLDVADSEAVTREVGRLGPFDVLINSAGMNRPKNLLDVPDQDIDDILALNIKAPFYLAREVAKGMVAAKIKGSIVNIVRHGIGRQPAPFRLFREQTCSGGHDEGPRLGSRAMGHPRQHHRPVLRGDHVHG